ncbi:MAG: hypothetical protein M5U26_12470 [Planctomycetota bacterium]|nr:hypothetical protein [Planctomycetota bacterium]
MQRKSAQVQRGELLEEAQIGEARRAQLRGLEVEFLERVGVDLEVLQEPVARGRAGEAQAPERSQAAQRRQVRGADRRAGEVQRFEPFQFWEALEVFGPELRTRQAQDTDALEGQHVRPEFAEVPFLQVREQRRAMADFAAGLPDGLLSGALRVAGMGGQRQKARQAHRDRTHAQHATSCPGA